MEVLHPFRSSNFFTSGLFVGAGWPNPLAFDPTFSTATGRWKACFQFPPGPVLASLKPKTGPQLQAQIDPTKLP